MLLVIANTAMLNDRESLCLLKYLSVWHYRQYQHFKKTGIIPDTDTDMKKFPSHFRGIATDGQTDTQDYSKVLLLQRGTIIECTKFINK